LQREVLGRQRREQRLPINVVGHPNDFDNRAMKPSSKSRSSSWSGISGAKVASRQGSIRFPSVQEFIRVEVKGSRLADPSAEA
jgi:hypothetical protein